MTVQDANQYQVQHQATLLVKGMNNQLMQTTASVLQSACIAIILSVPSSLVMLPPSVFQFVL